MKRALIIGALALCVSSAHVLAAQRSATVLLRSGERVSGEFEDIQNQQVYLRVSQDDERRIQVDQVALIDFAGGANGLSWEEVSEARAGQLLLLRDGSRTKGQLVDVEREGEGEATQAGARITVIFRGSDGAEKRAEIEQVSRLYMGNFPTNLDETVGAKKPAEETKTAPAPKGAINVPANVRWVDTGVMVRSGQMVVFEASGEVKLSGSDDDVATPAGSKLGRTDPGAPIPQTLVGALLGRVGERSAPFGIGNQTVPLRMPAAGRLYLGVNDGEVSDNSGSFSVVVQPR
jgi:hypothetical protein